MKDRKRKVKIPSTSTSTSKFIKKTINKKTGKERRSPFLKLFYDRKIKQGLGPETYIKAANLLATGFSQKKYYGKNRQKKTRQAKLILQNFYDLSNQHGKVKLFRPARKNRKIYAKELGISKKFKLYPLPVYQDTDKYKVIKKGKKKKLKLIGRFIDTELFEFPNIKKVAKNPNGETVKLLKEIDNKFGDTPRDMKIKCGEWLSHFTTNLYEKIDDQNDEVIDTINFYFEKYKHDAKKWLRGIQVTTFKKQESYNIATQRRAGKYLEKKRKNNSA